MNFLFGALCIYAAYSFSKHWRRPAETSRQNIKIMSLIIMIYAGGYGAYTIWLALGGAPWGGVGI